MESLIAATALFLGLHWGISGSPLRDPIVARMGARPFQAAFSLAVTVSLVWMGFAYADAPYVPTWGPVPALKPVSWVLLALAFAGFAASVTAKNPTRLGQGRPEDIEPTGIVRITRHAGLISLGLWGLGHFIVRGDWASHLLFGSFAIQGLIGPISLDRKYRRRHGAAWEVFARKTSYVPFAAIAQGRNRLVLSEINWIAVAVGLVLYGVVLVFHERWFGASPF
jgi:uncharacterized membrane protein